MDKFVASIRRKYRERSLNREEQWPPVSGERLINLQLVEAEKKEGFRAGLPQHGAPKTPVLHGDLFRVEEGRKPVKKLIVEGNAGIGKTTLCTMLAEGWAEGKILTKFDCVLLLPLRENRVSSATSLTELFKLLHSSEKIRTSVIEELEEKEGEGVLILADGWDELSEENRSKVSFLYDLLFGDVLPFASVLLTSRPSASAPLHNLPSVDRLVEVVGFNEENIKQYIASEFEQFPEKASSLIEQLENNPVIQSVCSVPLNCAIVCNLWHTLDQELPRTLTELYTQIVLSIILRNVKKQFPDCLIGLNGFKDIPSNLQDTFWLICEFAYECLLLDQLVFSEAELSSRLPEVGDKLLCFGLLQSARSPLPVGQGLSFHFAHLTIQEFLAALHLATLSNQDKRKVVEAHADSDRFDMAWRFMFGLASKCRASCSDQVISLDDNLMDQFLVGKKFDNLSLCHAAYEASDHDLARKVGNVMSVRYLFYTHFSTPFDCVAKFYILRHAAQCNNMVIRISNCAINDKLLNELTDILLKAKGGLQVKELSFQQTKLSDKGFTCLLKRASAAFTKLDHLSLCHNNLTDIMFSFSGMNLTRLDLSHNPLGVSGIQSLETAVQFGTLINLKGLYLSDTLTDDTDVNGALLTTLLQSITTHCAGLVDLNLSNNNLGLLGLCSVVKNIPLRLKIIDLSAIATRLTTSFHSESQYTVTCEIQNLLPKSFTTMYLDGSNFSGTAGTLLLAKFFQSLEELSCSYCSLTSADIIMLIHQLKSANVVCKNLKSLDLRNNCIDDEGVIALTKCLPELFPSLTISPLLGNPVSEKLILIHDEELTTLQESRITAALQNEKITDVTLSEIFGIVDSLRPPNYKPVEHHQIDQVVDTVDTPSDVTYSDTLINEQSFSQASPVEHHPTASNEATCTTALQSTHRTDQHGTALYTASSVLTDAVPSDVTEGDTSQGVLTSYPHTIHSGELSSVTVMEDVPESDIILIAEKFPPLLDVHKALTINNLQHVYEKLKSASPHWFNLGLALGLTHPDLTNINSEHRGNNVSCLREMLAKLLSTQHVTWSLLSDALKTPTVKLINLADSITGEASSVTRDVNTERKRGPSSPVMGPVCKKMRTRDQYTSKEVSGESSSVMGAGTCTTTERKSDQQQYSSASSSVTGDVCTKMTLSYQQQQLSKLQSSSVMEDVCRKTGVTDQQLDQEIPNSDIYCVAEHIEMTPGLLERLKLTTAEKSDATRKRNYEGNQTGVAYALSVWQRVNPSRATFRALVEIAIGLRRGDTATDICRFIVGNTSGTEQTEH